MSDFYDSLTEEDKRYMLDVMARNTLSKLLGLPFVDQDDVVRVLGLFDKLMATEGGADVPQGLKDYANHLKQKYNIKSQNAPSSSTVM